MRPVKNSFPSFKGYDFYCKRMDWDEQLFEIVEEVKVKYYGNHMGHIVWFIKDTMVEKFPYEKV